MTNQVAYLISQDGNITLVHGGKSHLVHTNHANYKQIREALQNENFEALEGLIDIPGTIRERLGNVTVENGQVTYKDMPVGGVIVERILEFMRGGHPFKNLVRFLDNLMENPSRRSISELYSFLEHGGFPITSDGCFIAYKGVRSDYKDKRTGTIDNSVGAKPARMNYQNTSCSLLLCLGSGGFSKHMSYLYSLSGEPR